MTHCWNKRPVRPTNIWNGLNQGVVRLPIAETSETVTRNTNMLILLHVDLTESTCRCDCSNFSPNNLCNKSYTMSIKTSPAMSTTLSMPLQYVPVLMQMYHSEKQFRLPPWKVGNQYPSMIGNGSRLGSTNTHVLTNHISGGRWVNKLGLIVYVYNDSLSISVDQPLRQIHLSSSGKDFQTRNDKNLSECDVVAEQRLNVPHHAPAKPYELECLETDFI